MTKNGNLLKRVKESTPLYLMMAPFGILFTVFTVFSVVTAIAIGFTDYNLVETPSFVGFSNYVRMLLDDDLILIATKNTLVFAIITGPISYFLCLLFAWMINEFPKPIRMFLTFIFYAPSISSSIYVVWTYIFSSDSYGLANSILMNLGFVSDPVQWLTDTRYILGIVIIVQLWSSLGTSFLAFIAGLQSVDKALYEAGAVDGIKNRFEELRYITLPSMGPQLMFAAVMQIGAAFSVSGICVALAGNPSTDYSAYTIVTHIAEYASTRYEMGYACALSTVLFLAMYLTNELIGWFLRRKTNL